MGKIKDEQWMKKYELAKEYYEENGHLLLLQGYIYNDIKLGDWIVDQRKYYKNNKLSKERINLLESIGMIWNVLEYQWLNKYEIAKQYYNENNNLLPPMNYKINDFALGSWVYYQRNSYKNNSLSKKQIELLENIGMIWEIDKNNEIIKQRKSLASKNLSKWKEIFEQAKIFYNNNGHLLIPQSYEINDIKLGSWISNQRQAYKNNKLSKEQINLLESIEIDWVVDKNNEIIKNGNKLILKEKWLNRFHLAEDYYNKEGNLLVPKNYIIENFNLGSWISNQRKAYKNNKLSKEQIDLLDSIKIDWVVDKKNEIIKQRKTKVFRDRWMEKYEIAKQYYKENGNLLVPQDYKVGDFYLGRWISECRYKYKNQNKQNNRIKRGEFSIEQINLLNDIKMIWDFYEAEWLETYNIAKKFYEKYGHLYLTSQEKFMGYNLGVWLSWQRNNYRNTLLPKEKRNKNYRLISKEKIDLLNEIEMIWDKGASNGTSFPEYFIYYCFKNVYGDKVFYKDTSLGFEIDVYIPYLKIGIEYDGYPWHLDSKERDEYKIIEGRKNNVFLYRLREPKLPILQDLNDSKVVKLNKNPSNKDYDNYLLNVLNELFDNIFENINIEEIYDDYNKNIVSILNRNWINGYNHAKKYYEKNGNLKINTKKTICDDGFNLGNWIETQRRARRGSGTWRITQNKIDLLDKIGMEWDASIDYDYLKEVGYNYAKKYYEKNGNLLVPERFKDLDDNYTLGRWIGIKRMEYKKDLLNEDFIKKLEEIGMVWDVNDFEWDNAFSIAKSIYDKNQKPIPYSLKTNDGFCIGDWYCCQRQKYKNTLLDENERDPKIGILDSMKMDKLKTIGIEIDSVKFYYEENWNNFYEHAKSYYEEKGNLLVPHKYIDEDGCKLGNWICNLRLRKKNGKLTNEQISQMDEIGMVWYIGTGNYKNKL